MKKKWQKLGQFEISDLNSLKKFCIDFSTRLTNNSIVLLQGVLASGKSELVRQFVLLKQPNNQNASSPTFALHHSYNCAEHWDLYRLKNDDELESSGFWDMINISDRPIFIEWPERIQEEWLASGKLIYKFIFHISADKRYLEVFQAT